MLSALTLGSAPGAVDLVAQARPVEEMLLDSVPTIAVASRFDQTVREAPASISIVTADEIRAHGWTTLADILTSIRGLNVVSDRNYSYLGARGFGRPSDYNSRVLLLVNGNRLNDNVYDGAYIGTEGVIDASQVERVEVIRGPGSSLYGTSAFFAVVNVVTKTGRDVAGGQVTASTGSLGSVRGSATWGRRFGSGIELIGALTASQSDGVRRYLVAEFADSSFDGIARNLDRDERIGGFVGLNAGALQITGHYSRRSKLVPTAAFGTLFNDPRFETTDGFAHVGMRYQRTLRSGDGLTVQSSYSRYDYDGAYPYDTGLYRDFLRGRWLTSEVSYRTRLFRRHQLIGGVEYRWNASQRQGGATEGDPVATFGSAPKDIWAVFGVTELRLSSHLIVNVGIRHDHYQSFGGTTNPRVAAILGNDRTSLKVIYGQAFRAPNAYELSYQSAAAQGTFVTPERVRTLEAAIEHQLIRGFRVEGSVYGYRVSDLIVQVPMPTGDGFTFANLGTLSGRGVEVELTGTVGSSRHRASYSYQRVKDLATGQDPANSPRHLLQVGSIIPVGSTGLTLGLEGRAISRRQSTTGSWVDAVFLGNLVVSGRRLAGGLGGSIGIFNVAGNHYFDPSAEEHVQGGIRQDGRTFRVTASIDW